MSLQAVQIEKKCSHRSDIAAYIDGELASHDELEFEMHLTNCKSCAAELNEQKKLLRALDFVLENEREIKLPDNFTKVIVANAESKVSGLRRPQERLKALFVCAALFLMVILGLGGETKTVLESFGKFADQFLAVGGFAGNLIFDTAIGAAIILRSLSHQLIFNSTVTAAFLLGLFFILLAVTSRFVTRLNRS